MEYKAMKETEALNNMMDNLEAIGDKSHLNEEIQRLFESLENLEGGEACAVQLSDVLELAQSTAYYEGLLMGAKLFKMLNGQ